MKDIKFKDKIAQGINDLFYIRYCTALSMTMKWYEKFRPL